MLTGKQKSYLRGLMNTEKAVFQIGKDGITENLVISVSDYLEAHEIVKFSLLKSCDAELREVAFDLASATRSEIVQLIGRTGILYRASKERKIHFPK